MAWALVSSAAASSVGVSNGSAPSTNATIAVAAGNRLFLYYSHYDETTAADVNTPTDSQSLAWTKLVSNNVTNSGEGVFVGLYTAVATATGSLTVTLSAPAIGNGLINEVGFTLETYSGLDSSAGAGCLDVSATAPGNFSSAANVNTGTTSPTHAANQLAVCMVGDLGVTATWTLSTANGFVKDPGASIDADQTVSIGVASKLSAAGATEGAVWTSGGTLSNEDCGFVAVIKLAGGAAPAGPATFPSDWRPWDTLPPGLASPMAWRPPPFAAPLVGSASQRATARIQILAAHSTKSAQTRIQTAGIAPQTATARIVTGPSGWLGVDLKPWDTLPPGLQSPMAWRPPPFAAPLVVVSTVGTSPQTATARLQTAPVTGQTETARLQIVGTSPQTATAHLTATVSIGQPATARITASLSATLAQPVPPGLIAPQSFRAALTPLPAATTTAAVAQTALARVQIVGSIPQPGAARVQIVGSAPQTSTARVQIPVAPQTSITPPRPPGLQSPMAWRLPPIAMPAPAAFAAAIQTATARIQRTGTSAQTATANLRVTGTAAQPATANLVPFQTPFTTNLLPWNALPPGLQSPMAWRMRQVVALSIITFTSPQTAAGRVQNSLTVPQTATGRIQTTGQIVQLSRARLQATGSAAQTARARLRATPTAAQTATARIIPRPPITNPQTAVARIRNPNTRATQPATARLRPFIVPPPPACAASVQCCAIRVAVLNQNGQPIPGPGNMYVTDALARLTLTPVFSTQLDITVIDQAGQAPIAYHSNQTLKHYDLTLELLNVDPELEAVLVGAPAYTQAGMSIGAGGPAVGQIGNRGGVSVEMWSRRIVNGDIDPTWPFVQFLLPRTFWQPTKTTLDNAPSPRVFTGYAVESTYFSHGPLGDWTFDSTYTFAYRFGTGLPAVTCGAQPTPLVPITARQTAAARIRTTGLRTVQTATALMFPPNLRATAHFATARMNVAPHTSVQATARIAFTTSTAQTSRAKIIWIPALPQTATARIVTHLAASFGESQPPGLISPQSFKLAFPPLPASPSTATATTAQTATARINPTIAQTATARLRATGKTTTTARAAVTQTVTAPQTGIARIGPAQSASLGEPIPPGFQSPMSLRGAPPPCL